MLYNHTQYLHTSHDRLHTSSVKCYVYRPGVTFPSLVWGLAAIPLAVWGVEEATGDWVLPSAAVPGLGFIIVLTIGAVEEGGLGTAKGDFCEWGMGSWPGMKGGKGWWCVCVREHVQCVYMHSSSESVVIPLLWLPFS